MDSKFGFTRMTVAEFAVWLQQQSVSRTITHVQEHHTFIPRYSHFNGSNHFERQKAMKTSHVVDRDFNDIGQHFSTFPDGMIVTGRPLSVAPACIVGHNSGGICSSTTLKHSRGGGGVAAEQGANDTPLAQPRRVQIGRRSRSVSTP